MKFSINTFIQSGGGDELEVRIRLKRFGKKKKPAYRIVAIPRSNARDGRVLEEIGYYQPQNENKVVSIDREKLKNWLDKGANLSPAVKNIIKFAE